MSRLCASSSDLMIRPRMNANIHHAWLELYCTRWTTATTRTGTPLENSRGRAERGRPANDNVCKVDVSPMALNPVIGDRPLVDGTASIARFSPVGY